MSATADPREIVILAYPGLQSLDLTGPLEVFHGAARLAAARRPARRGYRVRVLAPGGSAVRSSSGLTIVPDGDLEALPSRIDTLLLPGGDGRGALAGEERVLDWIREASSRSRRTAAVCTGAFLLAAAGLLDGRRAATHWAFAQELATRYPKVHVEAEPIYVRDGRIWTSAGVTAGMDLALALVEQDHDRELALTLARHLVLFLRRPGNQAQFSATLRAQEPGREPLRDLQRQILEDPGASLTVESLAERVNMSTRHFARSFRLETGMTPARYVQRVRLESARRRLEEGSESMEAIAVACGFGTTETMRRSFLRALAVGPAEYRRRFRSGAPIPRTEEAA